MSHEAIESNRSQSSETEAPLSIPPPKKKDRGSGKLGTVNDQNKQLIHLLRPWIMINLRIHSTRARKTRMSFYTAQDGSTRDLKEKTIELYPGLEALCGDYMLDALESGGQRDPTSTDLRSSCLMMIETIHPDRFACGFYNWQPEPDSGCRLKPAHPCLLPPTRLPPGNGKRAIYAQNRWHRHGNSTGVLAHR
ncbi:hypothetical protein PGTUg99_016760 [Puccinia graminis f. sp. tritici]|uniref:Uncharacterized protein n=1 Tax=Puccinia graminis f. sp. tritici TaxID=56615 RepID=A0A5B0RLT0_PUCGR|nr:hypothetical protein PGTUg99_016760 [Puccinia graminis f. sp. tritici]